jgi:hypothetical protein
VAETTGAAGRPTTPNPSGAKAALRHAARRDVGRERIAIHLSFDELGATRFQCRTARRVSDSDLEHPQCSQPRPCPRTASRLDATAGFETLLSESPPEELLRTELLHVDDEWRIQALWRDCEALAAMRSSGAELAAPKLFRSVGADPELTVLEVRASKA